MDAATLTTAKQRSQSVSAAATGRKAQPGPPQELTLNGPAPVGAQHDVDHEGELGGALGEGLDEPQHAEVVGQVDGVLRAFLLAPPHPEALADGRDVPAGRRRQRRRWEPAQAQADPPHLSSSSVSSETHLEVYEHLSGVITCSSY